MLRSNITFSKRFVTSSADQLRASYDALIVGGGHNGLTAAAYLAKAGKSVAVLERRHVLGGAAVTEEIVPGFRFSRASYLLSLFRPQVMAELKLKEHGLRYHLRDPTSFTPIRDSKKSLLLGRSMTTNQEQIAQFSEADAKAYPLYEKRLSELITTIEPLFDMEPLEMTSNPLKNIQNMVHLYNKIRPIKYDNIKDVYQFLTTPIAKILDEWFESDVLKATLSTDGVIGFASGPSTLGTGYVLLHHVMGNLDGQQGVWATVYGGMGAVSDAIARSGKSHGVEFYVNSEVEEILIDDGVAKGVRLTNGKEIHAKKVLSNLTPNYTFSKLVKNHSLPRDVSKRLKNVDYRAPLVKINVALREIPDFTALPSGNKVLPHHQTTVHMNCEHVSIIDDAFTDYQNGMNSRRPLIEMNLPSSVDQSIVDTKNTHVALIFSQYVQYNLPNSKQWDAESKDQYAKHIFSEIDNYAPNFSKSIVGYEILTPPDLESLFNMTDGGIFHGALSLDQLYFLRPIKGMANYQTPVKNLFLCGSSTHPGGGVTGGPGRLAALRVLQSR